MRTVADVMQKDVITVSRNTSIRELVRLMDDASVSGVPVVDEARKVVGVVSHTDVIRFAAEEPDVPGAEPHGESATDEDPEDGGGAFFVAPEEWGVLPPPSEELLQGSAFEDVTVAEIMTPVAYAVPPEMEVGELARFMGQGRIHRALVVEDEALVGIVTTFDLLRLLGDDDTR